MHVSVSNNNLRIMILLMNNARICTSNTHDMPFFVWVLRSLSFCFACVNGEKRKGVKKREITIGVSINDNPMSGVWWVEYVF